MCEFVEGGLLIARFLILSKALCWLSVACISCTISLPAGYNHIRPVRLYFFGPSKHTASRVIGKAYLIVRFASILSFILDQLN
jgi:hypothetical protein